VPGIPCHYDYRDDISSTGGLHSKGKLSSIYLKVNLNRHDVLIYMDVQSDKFFKFNMRPSRGHQYILYKNRSVSRVRAAFFSERVVNVCNSLPDSVDFSTLSKFRRSIMHVDFSKFLRCL